MTSTWAASLAHNYESAVESMRAVLQDCPDELWAANMWEVRKTDLAVLPPRGADGEVPEDPVVQERMLQAFSAVWSVAYHALFHLDYDLGGGIEPWSPPPPFGKDDQGAFVVPRTYTRDELLTYTDYCVTGRGGILDGLTDEQAAAPLPDNHRYKGKPYAEQLIAALLHLNEHAAQVRQFVTGGLPSSA